MLNSTSTIFTLDIYKPYFKKNATEKQTVNVGRISAAAALIIASLVAPFLSSLGQAFQYIQEYTGIVSPGILAVFLLGLFWKKANSKGAITGIIASIPIALFLKLSIVDLAFLDQMFYTTIITIVVIMGVSLTTSKKGVDDDPKAIPLTSDLFKTGKKFNISAYVILLILTFLYTYFW